MSVDRVLLVSNMPSNDGPVGTTRSDHEASWLAPAEKGEGSTNSAGNKPLFENPFSIEDLQVFDDATMQRMLSSSGFGLTLEDVAWSLHGASKPLVRRVSHNVSTQQRAHFQQELKRALRPGEVGAASVVLSLSCSAFSGEPGEGGEPGLAELKRVTRAGGRIVFIWARREDYSWLLAHGFHYVSLPVHQEMTLHFRSLQSAIRCAR